MDVRIDTQRRGIVHPIPRPGDGNGPTARGPSEPRGDSHSNAPALDAPRTSDTAAWFDANGDGVIESWSYSHGGDSFENFTPPPPRATGPSGHRPGEPTATATTASPRPGDRRDASSGTPAAIHHAHAAYRRDGIANAPAPTHAGAEPRPTGGSAPRPARASGQ